MNNRDRDILNKKLIIAIRYDSAESAARFIAEGADINTRSGNGWTLLQTAASCGSDRCICMLLELGADVKTVDDTGWTPLHNAAWNGYIKCMHLLIEAGADLYAANRYGRTPENILKKKYPKRYAENIDELADLGSAVRKLAAEDAAGVPAGSGPSATGFEFDI